jgi:hypothetical protein
MKVLVVFFGGFQASQGDMDQWLASARTQQKDVRSKAT